MVRDPASGARAGGARLGCVGVLVAFVALIYVVVPLVRSEMRYRKARDEIQDRVSLITVDGTVKMRERIEPFLQTLDLPQSARRPTVRTLPAGSDGGLLVTVAYADTLRIVRWNWIIQRRIEAETL